MTTAIEARRYNITSAILNQLLNSDSDPFDIVNWNDPEPFKGVAPDQFNYRDTIYFNVTTRIANRIDDLTEGEVECWLPSLKGRELEDYEKASEWARVCAGIVGNRASHIQREIDNGNRVNNVENRKLIRSLRKTGVMLKWFWLRKFDDESFAFALMTMHSVDSLRKGHALCQSLSNDLHENAGSFDNEDAEDEAFDTADALGGNHLDNTTAFAGD